MPFENFVNKFNMLTNMTPFVAEEEKLFHFREGLREQTRKKKNNNENSKYVKEGKKNLNQNEAFRKRCKRKGHYENTCFANLRKINSCKLNENLESKVYVVYLDEVGPKNICSINGLVDNKILKIGLDCGATNSIMNHMTANNNKIEIPRSNLKIRTANGNDNEYFHTSDLKLISASDLDTNQENKFSLMANEAKGLFAKSLQELDKSSVSKHKIKLMDKDCAPIYTAPYRISENERNFLRDEIDKMLKAEIIRPSRSPWSSPVVVNIKFDWSEDCEKAFKQLKNALSNYPVLRIFDPKRPLKAYTDESDLAIGGVLTQKDDDGQEYIVACYSRLLNKHEKNYSTPEKECLSLIDCRREWRKYGDIEFVTDHPALQWIKNIKNPKGRLGNHWSLWMLI
ncbi:unnamed protein product [Brachionus calyciflorus]|uniref:Reverse transcriptase/retrotransposon-derived protein RNase H-like domain-containing protein n=1 Tax=Brachionus calyciflorus TaxID=104777 RepID=A0A813T250_9BILA|nr:unnamed protein product [Brachionus calyciflorus]